MSFTDTYSESLPDTNTDAGTLDTVISQGVKRALRERLAIDHNFKATEGSDVTIGMHKKVSLIEQSDLGTGAVGTTILGSQTIDGRGEVVYTNEDDVDIQLTKGKYPIVSASGLTNLVLNGDFEYWSVSTMPDGWSAEVGGTVSVETTIVKLGAKSMKCVASVATQGVKQSFHSDRGINYWKGRKASVGVWLYCTTAAGVKAYLYDGVTTTDTSAHGGTGWERLTVTKTMSASATEATIKIISNGAYTYYADGVMVVEGGMPFAFSPHIEDHLTNGLEAGVGKVRLNSDSTDNFQLYTKTNTPNPNWAIGYGDGSDALDLTQEYLTSNAGVISAKKASFWIEYNCSAESFTDRTPHYEGDALSELKKVKGKDGQIDHSTLPVMAQKIIKQKNAPDEVGRDLGAMISILTVAVQQLIMKVEDLESRSSK